MSLVHSARNLLCHEFLTRTECQKLVFVDADCGWEAGALATLCTKPGDIVAGACRRRREPEDYAVNWLDTVATDENGLIEVEAIGMAFTCISRAALERFRDATPERAYTMAGEKLHAFFDSPVRDGYLWGEDFSFCNKWRELGGRIMVDPSITLQHLDGLHTYEGNLANWLTREKTT